MSAIRGAICAQNTIQSVREQSCKLFEEIIVKNSLRFEQIECVIFTATRDIDVAYPAKFLREGYPLDNVAFVCAQEMRVVGSLDHCLRICVIVHGLAQAEVKHCYLDGAEGLRPDLK